MKYYVQELDCYTDIYVDPIKSIDDYLQNSSLDATLVGIRFFAINDNKRKYLTNWMGNSYKGIVRTSEEIIDFSNGMTIQEYMDMKGIEPNISIRKTFTR